MKKKLLFIEDDRVLRETTAAFLESEGFEVKTAEDGRAGFELGCRYKADLIVTDLMLPGLNGLEICGKLREKGVDTPIIMLTGRKKDEIDKVMGLDLGADDYMTKPFGQRELLARIRAVLRRGRPAPKDIEEYAFGDVALNFKKKTATKGRKEIYLTAREYDLLKLLIVHESEVINRETILNKVWGYEKFPTTRTVDTFIHNLRKKIEKDPAAPRYLLTIPWAGYKFQK
ncbi:MAG: response regulator transcription factor [Candidatus Aminicenantes bacterium]|nr:response regulator transcription factor [Candidatus Aminicenantes bacterium]